MAEHLSATTTTIYTASASLRAFIKDLLNGIPAPPGREGTTILITDEIMENCTLAFATPSIKQLLGRPAKTNKILEFTGDAAIELAVTHWLAKRFPDEDVGTLTWRRQCVVGNDKGLMVWGKELDLEKYIGLETEGRKTLPSVLEAIVGAIYNHLGYEYVLSFVTNYLDKRAEVMFDSYLPDPIREQLSAPPLRSMQFEINGIEPHPSLMVNYRGNLEEYLIRRGFSREDVIYKTSNDGKDNNLAWVTSVTVPVGPDGILTHQVSRPNKKAGIAEASRLVLEEIKRMEADGIKVQKDGGVGGFITPRRASSSNGDTQSPLTESSFMRVASPMQIPAANYKGLLQILLHKRFSIDTPPTFISHPSGPPHDCFFSCSATITVENKQIEAKGEGKKKIDAEQVAARGLHDQLANW